MNEEDMDVMDFGALVTFEGERAKPKLREYENRTDQKLFEMNLRYNGERKC